MGPLPRSAHLSLGGPRTRTLSQDHVCVDVIDFEHSHDRRAPYVGVAIDEASGYWGGLRVTERGGGYQV